MESVGSLFGWGVVAVGGRSGEIEEEALRTRMREAHTDEDVVMAAFIRVRLSHPCA